MLYGIRLFGTTICIQGMDKMSDVPPVTWKASYTKIVLFTQKGLPDNEIAKRMSIDPRTIRRVKASPEFQSRLQAFEQDFLKEAAAIEAEKTVSDRARRLLEEKAYEAANILSKLMKRGTSKDRLRFDAAKEILHIAGIKPVEIVETRERAYSPEEVESAKKTMLEIAGLLQRINDPEDRFMLEKDEGRSIGSQIAYEPKKRSPQTDENSKSGRDQSVENAVLSLQPPAEPLPLSEPVLSDA